jgi:Cft2 family RNA processing exonuclease
VSPPRLRFDASGIEVEGGLLWLDSRRPRPLSVVTHAHADHVARHERAICTRETAALLRKRLGPGTRCLELPLGEPLPVGDLRLTLLPAGHILGSAMAFLEGPGGTMLYTGDVRLEGGLTTPPAAPRGADLLVTEATYGRPDHCFPPAEETRARIVGFARAALAEGKTPVLLAYALGKAQEVMRALGAGGIRVAAHGSVWNLCTVYRQFGIHFPKARRLGGTGGSGKGAAIVVPPRFLRATEVQAAAPLRVAAVTGWGERTLGNGVEEAFPLSDHSDYRGLLALVEAVAPKRVEVVHGYAAEFAQDLRDRGYPARAVPGHAGPDEEERPGMFGPG